MPRLPLPPDIDEFFRRPNPAVVASIRSNGTPHTVATWYAWDGDRVLLNMDEGRLRLRFMRRNPQVALTAMDAEGWHRHVSIAGRIESITEDQGLHDRLALHYTGQPFRTRDSRRFSALVAVDAWHAWAGAEPWQSHESSSSDPASRN